jgi:hypothetical protein
MSLVSKSRSDELAPRKARSKTTDAKGADPAVKAGPKAKPKDAVAYTPQPGRAVTLHDVARHAGVGSMTVSRVIRNLDMVSPAMRERVMTSVKALNYQVNAAASQTRSGSTAVRIGVLYSNPSASYLSEFMLGGLSRAPSWPASCCWSAAAAWPARRPRSSACWRPVSTASSCRRRCATPARPSTCCTPPASRCWPWPRRGRWPTSRRCASTTTRAPWR